MDNTEKTDLLKIQIESGRHGAINGMKKGAMIKDGRSITPDSPMDKTLKKCDECTIRKICEKYKRKARCWYQIQSIHSEIIKLGAYTSGDPKDLLLDFQTTIVRLESAIRYNEVLGEPPKPKDLKDLAFLKLQIYELLYVKNAPETQVNIQQNFDAPMLDIKNLMEEMRKKGDEKNEETKS